MDPNKSEKTTVNNLLDEFDLSSISSAGMDMKEMAEEIQKLKAEVEQIKDAANSNQFGGLLMMQIGEKFGKMEKEIDGLKSANRVEIRAFEELKGQMVKMTEAFEGLKVAEDEEKSAFEELKKEYGKLVEENVELKESIGKLAEENGEMREEIRNMKAAKDEGKVEMEGLKEEVNKMKEEFSVKNGELETQIAGLNELSKKLEEKMHESEEQQKTDKETLVQLNKNKWNAADCGPKSVISGEELVVKHVGGWGWNCIRVILPIPSSKSDVKKPSIASYFEVEIVGMNRVQWMGFGSVQIGFCTRKFPLEGKWLGEVENSIGIRRTSGMHIDGQFKGFANAGGVFKVGDVVGVGIIYSPANFPLKCFATCNGKMLGTLELPDKFASLQLFPAASLFDVGDSIRANFGQQKWRYDPSQLLK